MVLRPFLRKAVRMSSIPYRSILRWRRVGWFMIEPPKLSPFSGISGANCLARLARSNVVEVVLRRMNLDAVQAKA